MKIMGILLALLLIASSASADVAKSASPGRQVRFWSSNEPQTLSATAGPGAASARRLEELPLILPSPATVNVGTEEKPEIYKLEAEGLYRVYEGGKCIRQVIRYSGDVFRLAGHISRIQVHGFGYEWNKKPIAELDKLAASGEMLRIQCGPTCNYAVAKFKELGLQARYMGALPVADFNGWNDGHALMEVFHPTEKRWIVIDEEMGVAFKSKGKYLDMVQVIELYRSGARADLDVLNADTKVDPKEDYAASLKPYKAAPKEIEEFVAVLKHEPRALHGYYKHVFGVPLAQGPGLEFGAFSGKDKEALLAQKNFSQLKSLPIDEFRKKYYPSR